MTAETSNARGEVAAWQYRRLDPEDGIGPWIGCSESDAEIIRRNTFHEVRPLYAAAPPPAAARGDVRGLVALAERVQYADTHALVSNDDAGEFVCLPPWLWLEIRDAAAEALAAEGVRAGEVECDCPGKGKDDPALHAPNCPARLSQQPEARVYQCPRCATSMEVDPTAKPEARGGGEVVATIQRPGWPRKDSAVFFTMEHAAYDLPPGTPLYTAPPSAPVAADWITGDGLQGIKAEAHFLTQHKEEAVQRAGKRLLDRADKIIAALYQPPSAPVGVDMERFREPVVLWGKAYEYDRHGREAVVERRKPIVDELLAIIDAAIDQQPAAVDGAATNSAVAAIQFALKDPEGMTFLRLWNEGEFGTLRREWPDAPVEVYIDADPLAAQPGGSDNDR